SRAATAGQLRLPWSSSIGAHTRIASWRRFDHFELAFARNARRDLLAEIRLDPFAPIRPPRARLLLRSCEPILRGLGHFIAYPIPVLVRTRRIDHPGDMPVPRQHDAPRA